MPAGGLTISTRDAFIDTGTVFTGTGALTSRDRPHVGNPRRVFIESQPDQPRHAGARLAAWFDHACNRFGRIRAANLEIELRGTTVDRPNDQLIVTDGALLGGDLDVTLLGGFAPVAGNTFTILTAGLIVRYIRQHQFASA